MSIRWKMTLVYTGLLAILLVAFGFFLSGAVEQLTIESVNGAFTSRFTRVMRASASITTELAGYSSLKHSQHLPTLERLSSPGFFLQIRDHSGRVIATSSNLATTQLPPPTEPLNSPGQVQQDLIRLPVAGLLPEAATTDITTAHFLLRSSLLRDQQGHTVGILEAAQSLFIVDEVQDQLIDVLLLGIVLALVLAVLVGIWLAGRLLRPVARVTHLAQQIGASHDLSRRITTAPRSRYDEVGQLALTFNTMLERLEATFLAQQQFVADASHELKSPLTAILGHANVIRRHGHHHPDLAMEALQEIIEQAERMHRIIEDLLTLAKMDERKDTILEVISIHQIVSSVIREFLPLAQQKAIELTMSGEVLIRGQQDLLRRVVINLVDNALKFTPEGGNVHVTLRRDTGDGQNNGVFEVQDSGCGIASTELPHIFERWYRVDKARTRATGGSGLGLSIVQAIAEYHGGTVSVESQPGQGSTFRVCFPATESTEE